MEVAKRQADMKKPGKRDNTVADKKAEKMNVFLNDLEENFFKHVAEDNEQLEQIKQRGEDGNRNHDVVEKKEEKKQENGVAQTPPPQQPPVQQQQ